MMQRSLSANVDNVVLMPETLDTVDVLKRVMDDHNVNQSEFALEAGVSYVTVNRWLNRRSKLTEKRLAAVLSAIGVAPEAYGLDVRKLPRAGTADLLVAIQAELESAEERARLRHDETMQALRDLVVEIKARR
jgi:transcriptional regulator with XRE-family HTH domain